VRYLPEKSDAIERNFGAKITPLVDLETYRNKSLASHLEEN